MLRPEGYTVTGNIGRFKQGQVLTDTKDIADYHRAVLNEDSDPTTLSDGDILACVAAVNGDGEDEEMARIELMQSGNIPAPAGTAA